jgi:hypothetical protein
MPFLHCFCGGRRWIGQGGNQLGFDVDERIVLTGLEHKGGDRYLTHMKRLTDPEGAISLFLERANRLGTPWLGPILVQVNPSLTFPFFIFNISGRVKSLLATGLL